jgi:hypothetical protein
MLAHFKKEERNIEKVEILIGYGVVIVVVSHESKKIAKAKEVKQKRIERLDVLENNLD